jgi:hypothetical protein
MDIQALGGTTMPYFMQQLEALRAGKEATIDKEQINADLARLPDKPDENLP